MISANGGNGGGTGTVNGGGGGGGGRIALLYSALTYSGTSSTAGGAKGASSNGVDGGTGSIYTFQLNVAPNVPSSLGPTAAVNGSTTSTNNPILSFSLSDPDAADTTRFHIQIDDSSDFSSPVVDYTSALATQGARTFQVGQAAGSGVYTVGSAGQTLSNASYYWRVRTGDPVFATSSYSTANSGSIAFVVDATPRFLSFERSSSVGLESLTATSVKILLDQTHFENVTVNYSIIAASSTAEGSGTDYTLSSGTATITAGQTSTTFSLSIVNDDIDEPNETIGIQLSSPTFAVIGSNTTTLYTITDNDTAGATITETSGSTAVTEGGTSDSFTVVLTSQPTSTVQIAFATSTYGLTLSTSTLYFTSSNWNTAQTVYVTGTNDNVYEGTHTTSVAPTVSATAYGYDVLSLSSFSTTITDNDTASVTVSSVTGSATEGGSTASYTLVLTSQPTSTVTIALTSDTAETSLSASSLSFTSANWDTPQTMTVTALNDSIDEPTYATSVRHTVTSSGILGYTSALSIASASVSIVDNDTAGVTLTESAGSTAVTEGGSTDSYTLVLTSQPTSTIRIVLTPQSDVTLSTSTIDFTSSNWNSAVTVTVTAVNDDIDEPSELDVTTHVLSVPSGFAFGYSSGVSIASVTTTVTDNDTAGVTVSTSTIALTEGGSSLSYTYVLTSQPTSTVQLLFTTSTNGVTLSTSTLYFTSSNWSSAQSVTISATNDTVYEATHTTSVSPTISATGLFAYPSVSVASVNVTITDNESSDIILSHSTLGVQEGSTVSYTVVLVAQPTSTVQIVLTPGTGLSLSTSTLTFTDTNWNTEQSVTITPSNDTIFTGNRSVTITQVVSSTNNFINVTLPSITLNIREDESQGGGGAAGGAAGGIGGSIGSTAPIWINAPQTPIASNTPPQTTPPSLPPLIVVLPPRDESNVPTPSIPETPPSTPDRPIVTILNPSDVLSLVEATNGSRNFQEEARYQALLKQDAREFKVTMSDADSLELANFVTYGISERSRALGAGERRAVVRDAIETMRTTDIHPADLERLVRGMIPQYRNLSVERQQLPRVRQTFRTLYGHDPNFQDPEENLAWNTLMYRMRFPRDLAAEKEGIQAFRRLFRKDPRDPFQWATVRVMGYVQR